MRYALLTALLAVTCVLASAQSKTNICGAGIEYQDRNMVDYTVTVRVLRGRVIDPAGVAVPRACVALFNSDHSKLLRWVESGDDGRFAMDRIKPGKYWLLTRDPQKAFCPAAARLQLRTSAARSKLIVHMEMKGIDSCSFCEAQ